MNYTTWSAQMALGNSEMDASHEALMNTFAKLAHAPDADFAASFMALSAAMEKDFRDEEEVMEQIDFEGLGQHREVHARVLGALHNAMGDVQVGNFELARKAIAYLPDWFALHMSTMDAVLAVAIEVAEQGKLPGIS